MTTKREVMAACRALNRRARMVTGCLGSAGSRTRWDSASRSSKPTTDADRLEWLDHACRWADRLERDAAEVRRLVHRYATEQRGGS